MTSLFAYHDTTLQYDLIQKFRYSHAKSIFDLRKVVLSSTKASPSVEQLLSFSLFIQLLMGYKGFVKLSTSNNNRLRASFRTYKDNPAVKYKVTLRGKELFIFFEKFVSLPNPVNIINKSFSKIKCVSIYSHKVVDLLHRGQLESQYKYIKDMQDLNLCVLAKSSEQNALSFFINQI